MGDGALRHAGVPEKIPDPVTADGLPEIPRGDVLHQVGLVQDHGVVWGKNRPVGGFPDRQIREQKVMVHDDKIRFRRAPPHPHDETVVGYGTFLPAAEFRPGVHLRPQRGVVRKPFEFGPVTGLALLHPGLDLTDLAGDGVVQ